MGPLPGILALMALEALRILGDCLPRSWAAA